ncbi:exonuclease domain-containing protein [Alphaproteobacteria bacterium]|nr:exonuclease domain-containing protein [Alphaproteobacteria bacterium]
MRQVVIDCETTGLNFNDGDRIIEVCCLELVDHSPTGTRFHSYVNPEKKLSAATICVTGVSDEQVMCAPRFLEIAHKLLAFIGDDEIVTHNAEFEFNFLNGELQNGHLPSINKNRVIDTLNMARQKFPDEYCSLDALCDRLNIDHSKSFEHGTRFECILIAKVYEKLLKIDNGIK